MVQDEPGWADGSRDTARPEESGRDEQAMVTGKVVSCTPGGVVGETSRRLFRREGKIRDGQTGKTVGDCSRGIFRNVGMSVEGDEIVVVKRL